MYLYHNFPILQIYDNISYHIGCTDTNTDIHSWLYQLVYACASCSSHRASGKFEFRSAVETTQCCPPSIHGSVREVNCSSVDMQVVSCHRYLVVFHRFVEQLLNRRLSYIWTHSAVVSYPSSQLIFLGRSDFWILLACISIASKALTFVNSLFSVRASPQWANLRRCFEWQFWMMPD